MAGRHHAPGPAHAQVRVKDESSIEMKEKVLAPRLGLGQRGAAQPLEAIGPEPKRTSPARDLDAEDPLAGEPFP